MRELRRWCRRGSAVVAAGVVLALASLAHGVPVQQTHRLEAGPSTVAFGYYWSEAEPVLRIAPGDIIDVRYDADLEPESSRGHGVAAGAGAAVAA